ncbi:hypothetical protein AGMMS49928_05440 [Spirochaetia bacterium]|nr:hypothetical protein AGMMS49928_05440 [Spirochaetia bacterium]
MVDDEAPRRVEARRGFSLSYRGKTLLSLFDPIAQAEKIAAELPVKNRTLYFCPSPLYGYGLKKLLDRLAPDSAILCVETDEKLMAVSTESMGGLLKEQPPSGHHGLALIKTSDAASLCAFVRKNWGSRIFRRVEILRLSSGWRLDSQVYDDLAAALIGEIALDWGNAMTLVKLGRRYIRNAIANLSLIPRSLPLSHLGSYFSPAAPVLVLGAGPSLDEVLPELLRFFGSSAKDPSTRPFGIVCVDTALPCLHDWEIKPDLAVALESQHWNLRDFTGLGDWRLDGWRLPLAMDLSALPATGRVLNGEVFLFSTLWTDLSFIRRLAEAGLLPESLPPLGSVGLSTAALALRISHGPVITAGLDFSFTLDRFHARSSPGHRDRLSKISRFYSILNAEAAFRKGAAAAVSKSGLPVRSDPALKNYRSLFEREFAGEIRLYDIAGSGLALGLQTLSLNDAFALLKGSPKTEPGTSHNMKHNSEELRKKTIAFILREQKSLIRLRNILSGSAGEASSIEELETLLDYNDSLWAHFPECAAAEGRRPKADNLSFLKRIRVEIDPLLSLFEKTLTALTAPP